MPKCYTLEEFLRPFWLALGGFEELLHFPPVDLLESIRGRKSTEGCVSVNLDDEVVLLPLRDDQKLDCVRGGRNGTCVEHQQASRSRPLHGQCFIPFNLSKIFQNFATNL